jgi:hypothetical protein
MNLQHGLLEQDNHVKNKLKEITNLIANQHYIE